MIKFCIKNQNGKYLGIEGVFVCYLNCHVYAQLIVNNIFVSYLNCRVGRNVEGEGLSSGAEGGAHRPMGGAFMTTVSGEVTGREDGMPSICGRGNGRGSVWRWKTWSIGLHGGLKGWLRLRGLWEKREQSGLKGILGRELGCRFEIWFKVDFKIQTKL
jgi:hypothetical protein